MSGKKIVLAIIMLGLTQTILLAQSPTTQVATVHLYQGKVFGLFSAKHQIYADGKLLCKLGRNSHCQLSLPAGTTTFMAKPHLLGIGSQPALTLALEPGKEYYLQGDAKFELFPPNSPLVLTEIVPNSDKLNQINHSKAEPALFSSAN